MEILESVSALRAWRQNQKEARHSVAFVPTMGNLHDGHLSLVELAKQYADKVVVSIFVNPLQFGPNEDYERYPRTFAADAEQLQAQGVDAVFVPSVEEMYPDEREPTRVVAPARLTGILEGATRPGHFDGVTTVVMKLFGLVEPKVAVFGQKDYQQFAVIQAMVQDLCLPIQLVRAPIARADDGLALSSRNQYLTASQRDVAPKLFVALEDVRMAIESGNTHFADLTEAAKARLLAEGFESVDYLEVLDAEQLTPVEGFESDLVILAVARLGGVRLLDNRVISHG